MNPLKKPTGTYIRSTQTSSAARGEPALWTMGGTLVLGVLMIIAFLILILWNGITTFYPGPIEKVILSDGSMVAGEPHRSETFRPRDQVLESLDAEHSKLISERKGYAKRVLYKTGNYDLYNEDFKWVNEFDIVERTEPEQIFFLERFEWGPFIGFISKAELDGNVWTPQSDPLEQLQAQHGNALERREKIEEIEKEEISDINYELEQIRLALKRTAMEHGKDSREYREDERQAQVTSEKLNRQYEKLQAMANELKEVNSRFSITLEDVEGTEKSLLLSDIVRFYDANNQSVIQKLGIYFARWIEFLTAEPREANIEGGVMPAIFGTFSMTILLVIAVAPFGVVAALYLREYAKQGHLVSIVRISVNNLAGVPSIVYGVFGLGFFAYTIGGFIDTMFYPEKLPNPTYGTGGLLWASLTLALLTVPVVIVATEEALAAVPQSLREGSLACGASKWQTIKNIVLPKALPGILTGLILAMARGAGEVAPLMLVGVVKMAPELPIDGHFPYIHLERSFMHLGFHIFDVGFQSRNAEAGKPMVFVTTLLLITMVALMNAIAIYIRNRLNKKFSAGHF